jgi:hypothetical protein
MSLHLFLNRAVPSATGFSGGWLQKQFDKHIV